MEISTVKKDAAGDRRRDVWAGALLVVVTVLAYFPALRGGFIWDDDAFLTENKIIQAGNGLYRFWCTTQSQDYWPVTYSPLWFEWRLWGLHTLGYHAVNLGLHLSEALLLWAVLRRLKIPGAYLAAFVFAVHPVNVESVAWITQRKNVMAMLFYLASLWCFLKTEIFRDAAENHIEVGTGGPPVRQLRRLQESATDGRAARPYLREGRWYALSLLAFTLGMLSKGSIAILPGVFLGLIAWQRRLRLRDGILLLPFFVVSAVLVLTDIWFQKHGAHQVFREAGWVERLLGAGGVVWFYLGKALLPVRLMFVYPQWDIRVGDPLWWVPLLAAIAFTVFLWHYRHRGTRPALFAWGYFCVALFPVMGFADVQFVQFSLVADHYQHLALIGVVVFAAVVWSGRLRDSQWGLRIFPIALVALLSVLTWRQCRTYRDAETLYRATLAQNPDCWMAYDNLGTILLRSGRLPEAIADYEEALRHKSDFPLAHNNLGIALAAAGRWPEAISQYREAVRLKPDFAGAYNNWANALVKAGRPAEAIGEYEEALRLKPDLLVAQYNLGLALFRIGRAPEAIAHLQRAVQLDPNYLEAQSDLADVLAAAGRPGEAMACYRQVLRLKPDAAGARYKLSLALANSGQLSEAIAELEQTIQLKPGYVAAHDLLGQILCAIGRNQEGTAQLDQAARLRASAASPPNGPVGGNPEK